MLLALLAPAFAAPPPAEDPIPLTLTYFSSEWYDGWNAANAVDGDLATAWSTEPDHLPGLLEFDLGGTYILTTLRVAWYLPGSGTQGYTVLVSDNGGISYSIFENGSSVDALWDPIGAPTTPIDFLRIQVNSNTGGEFAAISEIEAYGIVAPETTGTTEPTGPTDTGAPPTDTGAPPDPVPTGDTGVTDEETGCACAAGAADPRGALALLGVWLVRRRAR